MRWCHSPSFRSLVLSGATFFWWVDDFVMCHSVGELRGMISEAEMGVSVDKKWGVENKHLQTKQNDLASAQVNLSVWKNLTLWNRPDKGYKHSAHWHPLSVFQHPIPHIKRPIVWSQRWCFQWSSAPTSTMFSGCFFFSVEGNAPNA